MRFYLISDNMDTQLGMRLAGIDGTLVHKPEEARQAILDAMERKDVAIILVTPEIMKQHATLILDLKLRRANPLIVEIPDRHGSPNGKDSITRYVQEAVGIKL